MICKNCGTENDEDSIFCKKCGFNLLTNEEYKIKKKIIKKKSKPRVKKKIIKKVKTKKVKEKNNKKPKEKVVIKKEMSIFQSAFMFLLSLLCVVLLCVIFFLLHNFYNSDKVKVPYVLNLSEEQAELKLAKSNLKIKKVYKTTDNIIEENVVLKQSKKEGEEVRKNSIIKIIIGKYEKKYILENLVGMPKQEAINILTNNSIKYNIIYKNVKDEKNDIVLSQSPKENTKMTKDRVVNITVSKLIKEKVTPENENKEVESDE